MSSSPAANGAPHGCSSGSAALQATEEPWYLGAWTSAHKAAFLEHVARGCATARPAAVGRSSAPWAATKDRDPERRASAAAGEALLRAIRLVALYADYLRAVFGLALTLGPLLLLEVADVVKAPLAALGLVFAWFGIRTVLRHLSRVELSESAIALRGPVSRHLAWGELEPMKLAYYAPRRARGRCWLQLTLRGAGGRSIRLDLTLDRVRSGAPDGKPGSTRQGLALDAATHANLAASGSRRRAATMQPCPSVRWG